MREVHFVRDPHSNNQAVRHRLPATRAWVMDKLRQHFGTSRDPDATGHSDFQVDWNLPETSVNYRAVFVGSRTPLILPALAAELPQRQVRASEPAASA
jgi:hypothetical protein